MTGIRNAGRAGRLLLGLALLALGGSGWVGPVRADEPAKELTEEERDKLEKETLELNDRAVRLYRDGKYAAATELMETALRNYRRLYSPDKFPDGHPALATSLNNLGLLLRARGEYGKAERLLRDALDMRKRLYPPDEFPDGHPSLAESLNNLGFLLEARGEYSKAERHYRDALDMYQKLYPSSQYPDGHPDLAGSLNNLGTLLVDRGECGAAEGYYRGALEMYRKLYPVDKYPDGHPALATSLNNLGGLLEARGEYAKAERYFRDALEMKKRLFPADKYPDGHPGLAASLNNLGALLKDRGEYGTAERRLRDALDIYKRLYPSDKYPDGHADLARSLNNLGVLLEARGEYGKAEGHYRDALDMYQKLYPSDQYPDGHPDLAMSLNNLGIVLEARGEYDKAEPYLHDALDMIQRLYPHDRYPDGHPDLAGGLNNLGVLLVERGNYGKAEGYYRDALDMYKRLYPSDKYLYGHPDLAASLNNLGALLVHRGQYGKAADTLAQGAAMYDRLILAFAENGAEAEALDLTASLPATSSLFLAATGRAEGADPARDYAVLWPGKAAIARALERRRRLLRAAAAADEKTQGKLQQLETTREDLARMILSAPRPGDVDRAQLLKDLTDRKERLENELAALLPPAGRETPSCTALEDRLPDRAAFVDLYRYLDWNPKTEHWGEEHYAAFVLRKGRPIGRVELDDGAAIDKDLGRWRQDIDKGFASDAAGRLRKSVWEPIIQALGDGVDTVYVCPDGDLAALPWPALPGDKDGRVLMEDYTFATVQSGLFLLERLAAPTPADREAGVLLAVGGVRYDRDGAPADKTGKPWPALPATQKELAAVAAQARQITRAPEIAERSGADADLTQLLKDLPRARWAHLATHGFFAAPDTQAREHLFRPDDFLLGVNQHGGHFRLGAAARNPLTQSGLVLAGANQPTDADPGLLTGEAIAGLDLDGMDLAVLSACQTGLGEQSAGEGVFGLQRAFHIAGAKNVVASLWTVDDNATAALMNLFYYHLWEKGEPPLEALHHAQLELYRNPQALPALAKGRGAADWDETVQVVTKAPAAPKETPKRPAAVKDWAAFVLSGAGR